MYADMPACFVCVGRDDFVLFKFQFFFDIFGLSSQCIIFPNCIFYKRTNLNVHSLRLAFVVVLNVWVSSERSNM